MTLEHYSRMEQNSLRGTESRGRRAQRKQEERPVSHESMRGSRAERAPARATGIRQSTGCFACRPSGRHAAAATTVSERCPVRYRLSAPSLSRASVIDAVEPCSFTNPRAPTYNSAFSCEPEREAKHGRKISAMRESRARSPLARMERKIEMKLKE